MKTHTWKWRTDLPSGHTLYTDENTGRVAIADESGTYPENTDDGVLWLNTTTPLQLHEEDHRSNCLVPLFDEQGRDTRTIVDVPTMFLLAIGFDWEVNVRGIVFEINRKDRKDRS